MKSFKKTVLSRFLATECDRQLRLMLTPEGERPAEGMPPDQPPRPGLEQITQAGEEWQAEKLADLTDTFGEARVIGPYTTNAAGRRRYSPQPLRSALAAASPDSFIVEAEFGIGTAFEAALGIDLSTAAGLRYSTQRPDIVAVSPPATFTRAVGVSGEVVVLHAADGRHQLRVIDIKLTAEPSPSYFAEVTFYTLGLAAWLIDEGLTDRFVVVPDAAIWPGSHEASELTRAVRRAATTGNSMTYRQMSDALELDLEPVPYEVFAFRVREFFRNDIPRVLDGDWRDLAWHVDNRCKGCDFLGDDRGPANPPDPLHCVPTALRTDQLSRVAFLPRGASRSLREQGVSTVTDLAGLAPADARFDAHYALRATRTVVSGRAASFGTGTSGIPPQAGSSAALPKWADLRIYVSADFDLGSAITVAFGISAFWRQPRPFGATFTPTTQAWPVQVFMVDTKDVNRERVELLNLLDRIRTIIADAVGRDPATTVQIYVWDQLQYEHLTRVIGRHLEAILGRTQPLANLIWLFPPEDVLPNAELVAKHSHVTIVREVIRSLLAAPIPHYYSLLAIARSYHQAGLPPAVATFSVHPLYEDPLSDQIPSERAHEIWSRSVTRYWATQLATYRETVEKRLRALETVARQLENELRPVLTHEAPRANVRPPTSLRGLSADSQLWFAFASLNDALTELRVQQTLAMAPNEREARFQAARLTERLEGPDLANALAQLGLTATPTTWIYRLSANSREAKVEVGDFAAALSPEAQGGFLDRKLVSLVRGTTAETLVPTNAMYMRMDRLANVSVRALDRDLGLIAVERDTWFLDTLPMLETAGAADFSHDVILDLVHKEFFLDRLKETLRAIGNPPIATRDPQIFRALGARTGNVGRDAIQPVSEALWQPHVMAAQPSARQLGGIRVRLEAADLLLNTSQWTAFGNSLSHRFRLVWGPPGTGKSRTVRTIVLGALCEAEERAVPHRILITAPTYNAIDQVLTGVVDATAGLLPAADLAIARLRPPSNLEPGPRPAVDVVLDGGGQATGLRNRLTQHTGLTVVGGTPHQVNRLLRMGGGRATGELFDLIVVDEASQMDVPLGTLALAGLAPGGSVVVAGDPLQLPPIHKAEPPLGLESMVGSLYSYFGDRYAVPADVLLENYRSSSELVQFGREAGYPVDLEAHSPALRLNLSTPVPATEPADWPSELLYSPIYVDVLDPSHPAVCFSYVEGRSAQWNRFEADAIASLVVLLRGSLADQPEGEVDALGALIPRGLASYDDSGFWSKGIGIVTPHRAQRGLIVSRLARAFRADGTQAALIRSAVDTVERFQGQQRDVILASFALGDPDAIGDEEEFLLSLNRFNVMASRARTKLVVFVTQEVVSHLANELDTLRASRLLKVYVETFCGDRRLATLPYTDATGARIDVPGMLGWH